MKTDFFDYIKWRGDLSFESSPLNSVDALIFCQLSYLNFNGIVSKSFDEKITLKEAAGRFKTDDFEKRKDLGVAINPETVELLFACAGSVRFGSLNLCGFIDKYEPAVEEQFSAVTYCCKQCVFAAFRGTDDSIVGWKEDFNLGYKDVVPAQKDALKYLENAVTSMDCINFYCGGHSKGGNLAIYSAANLSSLYQKKLTAVYNFDGPGFKKEIIESEEYRIVLKKTFSFYPQFSIVGMLFCHDDCYKVVRAHDFLFKQHDPFNWEVMANSFVFVDSLEKGSELFYRVFEQWYSQLSAEQLELFVEAVFQVLAASDAETNSQLVENWFKNSAKMIKAFARMDDDLRKSVTDVISQLLSSAKKQISEKK